MEVRTVFRAFSLLSGGLLAARAASFFQNILLAHYMTREAYGDFTFASSMGLTLAGFSAMGIGMAVVREATRDSRGGAAFLMTGISARLIVAVLAAIVGISVALSLPWQGSAKYSAIIFCVISVSMSAEGLNEFLLTFQERAGAAMLAKVCAMAVQLVLVGGAAVLRLGVIAACIGVLIPQAALSIITSWLVLQRVPKPRPRPSWSVFLRILAAAWPVAILMILSSLYNHLDVFMLRGLMGKVSVAIYANGIALVNMMAVFSTPFTQAAFPYLARAGAREPALLAKAHNTGVKILCLAGFPSAVLGAIAAPVLIPLFYSQKYMQSIFIAQVLLAALPLEYLCHFFQRVMMSGGAEKLVPFGVLAGGLLNCILNPLFIPRYGELGAAVTTVASFAVSLAVLTYMTERRLHDVRISRSIGRALAVSAAMVAAWVILWNQSPFVQLPVAAIVGGAAVLVFHPFDREEIVVLRKALGFKRLSDWNAFPSENRPA